MRGLGFEFLTSVAYILGLGADDLEAGYSTCEITRVCETKLGHRSSYDTPNFFLPFAGTNTSAGLSCVFLGSPCNTDQHTLGSTLRPSIYGDSHIRCWGHFLMERTSAAGHEARHHFGSYEPWTLLVVCPFIGQNPI